LPARVCSQLPELKEAFRERIRQKLRDQKAGLMESLDEDLPPWVSWAIKPVAALSHDLANARDGLVGRIGEMRAAATLHAMLPHNSVLLNDVVLETSPEEFIQVDHVVVGGSGVYLIETKAWEGAVLCHGDSWKRKDGDRWVRCQSPTRQNERHARLFRAWLGGVLQGPISGDYVHPLVLFTRLNWLRAEDSSMPVFQSPFWMSLYIRKDRKKPSLTREDVERIVDSVLRAKPLSQDVKRS
jgi:hypothetical protein